MNNKILRALTCLNQASIPHITKDLSLQPKNRSSTYNTILYEFINIIMQLETTVKEQLEERFVFLSMLGKGSFGCVYECEDKTDNQIYAIKIIVKGNVKKSKMQCLREEARLLSSISHPNIVKVYEFVETDTFIFLRMEIIRNGTLEKLMKSRWESGIRFSDDQMAAIMGSIFRALNYIHSIHIIHRDIKPENILVPSDSDLANIKMADFGLSTKLDFFYPKTATSKCGTMLYMAPEILNNLSYNKLVDIWSCSIILFTLFYGKHPFYESKMTTEAYKQKIKKVVFPPLTNALAQDFLSRISKIDPNQRYTTLQALKHPWLTRNFDDQIPQSLHQSFKGFQKSHSISNLFKLLIATKYIINPQGRIPISSQYRQKQQKISTEFISLNLKKKSSRKFEKDSQSTPNLLQIEIDNREKQNQENKEKQYDKDTPAIRKLNKIFDTLLQRKPRNKQKFYTEAAQPSKQLYEPLPKVLPFKDRLEVQIDRFVREFKSDDCLHGTLVRKMLPVNKKKFEKMQEEKDQFRNSGESIINYTSFKIRHRKKNSNTSRLYD